MFAWCVCLCIVVGHALANSIETWPFEISDKYIEEFKKHNLHLVELTKTENKQIEYDPLTFDETLALKHASHFDFIIIGGGTSGAVLANRLSEIPEWKVLLLEAGDIENVATRVPHNWQLLSHTPYNWNFKTTPQNYSCLDEPEHRCSLPQGKILGGSSAINSMVYTRGTPHDYNLWADLGNEGWCFSDVFPYYKKLEDAHFEPFDKKYHHYGGKVHLEHPRYGTVLGEHALQAGQELGYHLIDYNGKHQVGVALPQLTTKNGQRFSTGSAYLDPVAHRPNLIVKPLSHVLKILISPHTKEAQGVLYLHGGEILIAKADKEVVLAAGAINSPKLLILSGIGPKEQCEELKIHQIVDLPTGQYLQVRPSFTGLHFNYTESKIGHVDEYHDDLYYLKYGKGPLTTPGIEALAYLRSNLSKIENYPDIELKFLSKEPNLGQIVVTLNHPKSRGYLKLHSSHPLAAPIIEPHLLTDEDELDFYHLLAGIEKALKFAHTDALHKIDFTIDSHPIKPCETVPFASTEYWKCALKYQVVPTGDVTGTVRMGPQSDNGAIVDNKLKVYGVHKLRVADSSVIPVPITGTIMGPSILIGEKAAHIIMDEWVINA